MTITYVIEWRPNGRMRWFREDMDEFRTLRRAREVAQEYYANPEEYQDGKAPQVRIVKLCATVVERVTKK